MKIAMIIPSLKNTAPNNIALLICRNAIKDRIKIDVYYIDEDVEINENSIGLNVIKLKDKKVLNNYDIIHSHGIRPDFINLSTRGNIIKVSTIHSFIITDLRNKYGLKGFLIAILWLQILKRLSCCATISNATNEFYRKNGVKCCRIYNGIDFSGHHFSKNRMKNINIEVSDEYINIVTIANLEKIKGLDQLLLLAKQHEKIHVHIIGEGSYRSKLIETIGQFNITDRVTLHGYVENASSLLDRFDAYVQPSISEGFGIAVIEALASRIPTVCSNIQVFKELFNSGEVELFELNNINSLFIAIKHAMNKSDESRSRIAEIIKEKFSSEMMSLNYLNWYKKLYEERDQQI